MKVINLLCLFLIISGCKSSEEIVAFPWLEEEPGEQYCLIHKPFASIVHPFLQSEYYDTVENAMEGILQADKEMFLEHEDALLAHIFESVPLKTYIKLVKPYRDWQKQYYDIPSEAEYIEERKALYAIKPPDPDLQIYFARDMYAAEMWNHKPRLYLYSIAENDDHRDSIRMVERELTHEEFRNHTDYLRNYPLEPEERIFYYWGGNWEALMGVSGFLFVRDDKIVEDVITEMN